METNLIYDDAEISKIFHILHLHLSNYMNEISETPSSLDSSHFIFERINGGTTNKLVKITPKYEKQKSILIKYFDPQSSHFIDRTKEQIILNHIGKYGIGKKVLLFFEGGQIEEWVDGGSIDMLMMGDPKLYPLIAERMATLHSVDIPQQLKEYLNGGQSNIVDVDVPLESGLWPAIWRFYELCIEEIKQPKTNRYKHLRMIDFNAIKEALISAEEKTKKSGSPVVLCHCDLLCGNIILSDAGEINFIDFEYCNLAERAFDIANHFAEYCGFGCLWNLFPSKEQQMSFLSCYLSKLGSSISCSHLYDEIQPFFLASHAYWGLWGLVQDICSSVDFDFWSYGVKRLTALLDWC